MNSLKTDRYWPPVARIDNVYGDRNLVCSCPPLSEYTNKTNGSRMTEHKARPKSGDKIINDVGVKAIKNGQKRRTDEQAPRGDKPKWLRFVSPGGEGYQAVKKIVRTHRLSTVCEEAMCPNIGECWSRDCDDHADGSVCTRACQFLRS